MRTTLVRAIWLAAITLLVAYPARAEDVSSQTVELVAPPGEAPEFVCVVNAQQGNKPAIVPAPSSLPTDPSKIQPVNPAEMAEAWSQLWPSRINQCDPDNLCGAAYEQPPASFANPGYACRRLVGAPSSGRVVVLGFQADRVPLNLNRVTAQQTRVTIEVVGKLGSALVGLPWVSVLGGNYQPSAGARGDATNPLRIALEPRCQQHILNAPPFESLFANSWASVSVESPTPAGRAISYCAIIPSFNGSVAVLVPTRLRDEAEVQLKVFDSLSPQETVYASVLPNTEGKTSEGRLHDLRFSWQPSCAALAPPPRAPDDCPIPSFPAAHGATCAPPEVSEDACHYHCTVGKPWLSLPARVSFRVDVKAKSGERVGWAEQWDDTLSETRRKLTSFTPGSDRAVLLDFSQWGSDVNQRAHRTGNRVNNVLVSRPDGTTVPVAPDRRFVRLAVPGLECGDAITYQSVGERDHVARSEPVRGGGIMLAPPDETDEAVSLNVHIGGGFERAVLYQVEQHRNYNAVEPFRPVLEARFSVETLPGPARLMLSLDARLASRGYFRVSEVPSPASAAYSHLMFGVGGVHALGSVEPASSTWFGYGLEIGLGYATLSGSTTRLGQYQLSAALYALLRYPLSRRIAAEVGFHWLPIDNFRTFRTNFLGAPSIEEQMGSILGLTLGFTFAL